MEQIYPFDLDDSCVKHIAFEEAMGIVAKRINSDFAIMQKWKDIIAICFIDEYSKHRNKVGPELPFTYEDCRSIAAKAAEQSVNKLITV